MAAPHGPNKIFWPILRGVVDVLSRAGHGDAIILGQVASAADQIAGKPPALKEPEENREPVGTGQENQQVEYLPRCLSGKILKTGVRKPGPRAYPFSAADRLVPGRRPTLNHRAHLPVTFRFSQRRTIVWRLLLNLFRGQVSARKTICRRQAQQPRRIILGLASQCLEDRTTPTVLFSPAYQPTVSAGESWSPPVYFCLQRQLA